MKKQILLGISLLTMCLATSCKKEGCTDKSATNFDAEAKKDNNTCSYEGSVVFWYGKETSAQMTFNASSSLRYYFDNELTGSSSADVYFTGAPNCGQDGSITITRSLGSVKGKSYEYRVEDQLGRIIWEGIVNLEAAECLQKELAF